jgi:hypothetical protein
MFRAEGLSLDQFDFSITTEVILRARTRQAQQWSESLRRLEVTALPSENNQIKSNRDVTNMRKGFGRWGKRFVFQMELLKGREI